MTLTHHWTKMQLSRNTQGQPAKLHDKTGDKLTKQHTTDTSIFSMQRNGTQKARSVTRIVTTIKPNKNYKDVSFKNKRGERNLH